MEKEKKYAILSLSGGMDSSTLLLHLLSLGYDVTALSFDYGQKHKVELEKARDLKSYINKQELPIPWIDHHIIKIEGLTNLLDSTLVEGGEEVPEGHYEQENMKLTVVPNRNKIFSSILQAAALSMSQRVQQNVFISLGIHAGDHEIYKDCRKEFIDADFNAFKIGNWETDNVFMYTPYLGYDKYDILKDGQFCCKKLGIDFNEVYSRTNTSYKPILHNIDDGNGGSHQVWFSDYKSAASVERILAFYKLGIPDPVKYANKMGLVSWEIVLKHTLKVEEDFKENEKIE